MRLERLLSIVFLLLNRDRISATDLADRFNVSVRTIYRDINTIDGSGIPIVSHPGQNGGFSILDTYRIDKQVLSIHEMASIVHALKGVNKALEDEELDLTIEKISCLLPNPVNCSDNITSPIALDLLPWGQTGKKQQILQKLYKAINNRNLIEIKYSKPNSQSSSRTVEPMTLLFKGYAWYLFAFCRLRVDFRIFKISRMKSLNISNRTFTLRDKDYQDIVDWSESSRKKIELTLKFSPKMKTIVEDNYPGEQLKYLENGYIIAKTEFPQGEWVYGYILSFGHFVEVLEPEYMRDIIFDSAEKIEELYKS